MAATKKCYEFVGDIFEFDELIERNWKAQTYAINPKKALSNLTFRWKCDNNRSKSSRVELIGDIRLVEGE